MVISALVLGLTTACSDGATGDSSADTQSTTTTDVLAPDPDMLALDPDAEPLQHLIVVSVDTLRWDAVSWNDAAADTPFLDSLAARALVLEDHRSCASWTLPSMLCYFSGQDTVDLGYEPVPMLGKASGIPLDFKGLTGWLKDAGWRTVLVPTNALVSDSVPIGNHFDSVLPPVKADDPGSATGVVDTARSWLSEHPWSPDDPNTYLHLHLLDPHEAYAPPRTTRSRCRTFRFRSATSTT